MTNKPTKNFKISYRHEIVDVFDPVTGADIPEPRDQIFEITAGESVVFFGPNGCGKTRLAVHIENQLGENVHRISASRSMMMNTQVTKVSEELALNKLKYGSEAQGTLRAKRNIRWQGKPETSLLNDFDALVQFLFAEQSNIALETHKAVAAGTIDGAKLTKLEKIKSLWESLLPGMEMIISGDNIKVTKDNSRPYPASDMSDGERAIFYMIGQSLALDDISVFIIDEPELHVHRSIQDQLWDNIEALRPECAFIYITHDLEFAVGRNSPAHLIKDFVFPDSWDVEELGNIDFVDDEIAALIIGGKRKALLTEGKAGSLDASLFRPVYPGRIIIPSGSCQEVIRSVKALHSMPQISKVDVSGIIDLDGIPAAQAASLQQENIFVLPVSEIENVFIIPSILKELVLLFGFDTDPDTKFEEISSMIVNYCNDVGKINQAAMRYCERKVRHAFSDLALPKVSSPKDLDAEIRNALDVIDVEQAYSQRKLEIETAIKRSEISVLAEIFDDKGLLTVVSRSFGMSSKRHFEEFVLRNIGNSKGQGLLRELRTVLPAL